MKYYFKSIFYTRLLTLRYTEQKIHSEINQISLLVVDKHKTFLVKRIYIDSIIIL